MTTESKCPVLNGAPRDTAAGARSNRDWWPNQLNLEVLHQNSPLSNPMGEEFNYAEEFCVHRGSPRKQYKSASAPPER